MEKVSKLKPRSKYTKIKNQIKESEKDYVIIGDTIYWLADDFGIKNAIQKLRHFTNRWGEKITAYGYGYECFGKWYYQHNLDRNEKYFRLLAKKMGKKVVLDKNNWLYMGETKIDITL